MWFKRDISHQISSNRDTIQVIRGPRQCGKTSLVLRLDASFREISLDDPRLRQLAQDDPTLFLEQFGDDKLFIDEAQHAPNLFPSLKRRADLFKRQFPGDRKTILRITGSNQIVMDRQVKESLAGRASFFDMNTLSVAEIVAGKPTKVQDILFTGGWPELHSTDGVDPQQFLTNYINSYVEKDVILAAGIQKRLEFLKFIGLLAGRVGEVFDASRFAQDVGVDAKTVRDWVSVLATMHLIALVPPYHSNRSKRLIKSPKVFFLDTGLAARLQGWTTAEGLFTSPMHGKLFENLVFAEIHKLNCNFGLGLQIYHWRSRDGEEIDFLCEQAPHQQIFVEAKVSPRSLTPLEDMPQVRKVFGSQLPDRFLCVQSGNVVLGFQVPITSLRDELLKFFNQG